MKIGWLAVLLSAVAAVSEAGAVGESNVRLTEKRDLSLIIPQDLTT